MERIPGVYSIKSLTTNRVYVGQSLRMTRRWKEHIRKLNNGCGPPKLQKDWDLYGGADFKFSVLEIVEDSTQLSPREQYYIDFLDSFQNGYNTLPKSGTFKGYVPNKEAREKLRLAGIKRVQERPDLHRKMVDAARDKNIGVSFSEEHKKKISNAHKGKPPLAAIKAKTGSHLNQESKNKIGDANRGRKMSEGEKKRRSGKKFSAEHLANMSKARKGIPWSSARRAAQEARKRKVQ